MVRTWFIALLAVFVVTVPARAADTDSATAIDASTSSMANAPAEPSRGLILPVLYVSYGALQAYDGFSTLTGVRHGAVEGNPLMSGVARRPAAVWAVKASVAALTISTSERLWRQGRRKEAIVVMIAVNGVMAAVAARNASVIRGLR